jgi:hypothetical protein
MKGVPSRIKKEKKVHELVIIGVYGLAHMRHMTKNKYIDSLTKRIYHPTWSCPIAINV